jgi:hypothetical protein
MRTFILFFLVFLTSCEKFTTEISDLTLSGKYVLSKLTVIETSQSNKIDTIYSINQLYINNSLSDPFDSMRVGDFHIHFDYSSVRLVWRNRAQSGMGDRWLYGEPPNEIFYSRVPWTYDAYTFGKISFNYKTKDVDSYQRMIFNVDSDLLESIQLSGLSYSKNNKNYRLILNMERIGP